jgi:nifR3 family TIM-barrel protein
MPAAGARCLSISDLIIFIPAITTVSFVMPTRLQHDPFKGLVISMQIGSVSLKNLTILAPLAGITNLPFRLVAKKAGCALVCSEMISSNGLIHKSEKTHQMLNSVPDEKPLSVQLFGSDSAIMARAAGIVEKSGADILDLNFGCAVKKILKTGSGAALMKEPQKAKSLISAVRQAVSIPLTIKIRTGWDPSGVQAMKIAATAQECGVDAIAVHPRTAGQGFKGKADWSIIAAIKKQSSIPVIGNGDIVTAQDALQMIKETGCDAVMIGRTAIGKPWIFSEVNAALNGKTIPPPDLASHEEVMLNFMEALVRHFGEKQACNMMRSRLGWFVKGLRNSSKFRESIKGISSKDEAEHLIRSYFNSLGCLSSETVL